MGEMFAERWSRKQRKLGLGTARTQMAACGPDVLPTEAAPCLTFEHAECPQPIWKVFGVPFQWPQAERERLAPFRMIGSDGAGNPLCIDHGTNALMLLDHEDNFRTRQFVNSSVHQLAECLLAYLGEREPERFLAAVRAIDPSALAEGAFWPHEAAGIGARDSEFEILPAGEMRRKYGLVAENRSHFRLDPAKVPEALRSLIPLAEYYGVGDDLIRADIVAKMPPAEVAAMRAVVESHADSFDNWLAGPEAAGPGFSQEYIAFSCLRMAADGC